MGEKSQITILQSLQGVLDDLEAIAKDQKGEGQVSYKFRGINQVLNALFPLFKKHKVLVKRRNLKLTRQFHEMTDKYGNPKKIVDLFVECDFVFTSTIDGSEFVTSGYGEGSDKTGGDKSTGMAISNTYKYVIFEMFNIATEEQKDSDELVGEQSAAMESKKPEKGEKSNVTNLPRQGFKKDSLKENNNASSEKKKIQDDL